MTYVVIDTNCMIRGIIGISPYREALERLTAKCHIIAYSNDIMKEYAGKLHVVGITTYIFQRKLEDMEQLNKLKRVTETLLEDAKKEIKQRKLRLPSDTTDVKFLEAALAKSAEYIITTDSSLLVLNPYRHRRSHIEIVLPQDYLPSPMEKTIS